VAEAGEPASGLVAESLADRGRLAAWPIISSDGEATDRAIVADLRRASGRYRMTRGWPS
jgi:hypothetical protein